MSDNGKMKNIELSDRLSDTNLDELCHNIRELIISDACKNGGFLGDNLSNVEIATAIKLIFSSDNDKIFVTDINSNKAFDILGFHNNLVNKNMDTETVFSCAYAQTLIKTLNNDKSKSIVIINVQSLNNAQILKRLKDIGDRKLPIIIILNDSSELSYNDFVMKILNNFRTSKEYINIKKDVVNTLDNTQIGQSIINAVGSFKDNIKEHVIKGGIFSDFGIDYLGTVDGHSVKKMMKVLEKAKESTNPVIIHSLTKKGKGYKKMEDGEISSLGYFEAVNEITGKPIKSIPKGYLNSEDIIIKDIDDYMSYDDEAILVLSTDYKSVNINALKLKYKERIIIDEGDKAIITASVSAKSGYHVNLAIDNNRFVKNGYDFLNTIDDNVKITIILFKSSICTDKISCKQGLDDIVVLSLCNIPLFQGKDVNETRNIMKKVLFDMNTAVVRVTNGVYSDREFISLDYDFLKWNYVIRKSDYVATVISYGNDVKFIENEISINEYNYNLVNATDLNHLDSELLNALFKEGKPIVVYASDLIRNGLGERIKLEAYKCGASNQVINIGIENRNFKSRTLTGIKKEANIELNRIFKELSKIC